MSDPLASWWVHPVTIRRWLSESAYGPTFAAAETVRGFVQGGPKLVRDSTGAEVVSSVQVALPITVAFVPPQSEVDLPAQFGGRTARVLSTAVGDGGGQPTPDHSVLNLV